MATCTARGACCARRAEESIRTPFTISGGLPRYSGNGRLPVVSNHVDIAPTTLGLCGIRKPDWMEGADLSPYRMARPAAGPEPDSAYLQNVVPTGHPNSINTPYRAVVTRDRWKYVCFENRSWLLFNLNDDPYEEANQAQNNRYRAERKKLIGRACASGSRTRAINSRFQPIERFPMTNDDLNSRREFPRPRRRHQLAALAARASRAAANRPNIIYIHSHDSGRYLLPYGYNVPTPNLQKLASEGILCHAALKT
jgi:arylsulfatase A-like enzyme